MTFEEIKEHISQHLGEKMILEIDETSSPKAIYIPKEELLRVMRFLLENDQLYFDSLSCLTAIDLGEDSDELEMAYNLYSIPYDHHLMLKVKMKKAEATIDSLVSIWRGADWHEREAYDLMGVKFKGHPDLRRILMPADWKGHPLRKDYNEQAYYRGVKVEY